jgi:polysaccharide export outer membrane protein
VSAGLMYEAALEVNADGDIRIPQLGTVRVLGLTERQVEEAIKNKLAEDGILPNPIVQVQTQNRRNRIFSIMGSVGAAGPYPIPSYDFRLLDAIAFARDIGPEVKKLYVIRRVEDTPLSPAAADRYRKRGESSDDDVWMLGREGRSDTASAFFSSDDGPTEPVRRRSRVRSDDDLDALLSGEADEPGFGGLRIERDEELGDRPSRGTKSGSSSSSPAAEPFDWEDVPELASSQRVIEIDVRALKNGDPRYNVVIRDRDIIQVPVDTGVYYLMGEVARPGVYAFGGREITVKQALAAAGGFTPLGWPARCEIIRREPGTDKQLTIPVNVDAIFAGTQPDILLRPDDIFNAGTDVAAPFLFVLRNSFRFTYGFGFVYDRNFADQDSYYPRANPEVLNQARRQQQGLGF